MARLTRLTIFLVFFFAAVDARIQLPSNVTIPAVMAFGDSILDTGNNNYILTVAKADFPPYGKDFMDGRPTGRFCNGMTPSDIIAEELGVKSFLPPYLNPELKPQDLLTGVCFASAASGYDPLTAKSLSVIPLSEQLNLFKEYIGKITTLVGEDKAKFIISKSVYLIVAGSNDLLISYFDLFLRRPNYDPNSYTDLMLTHALSFIQELYGLGARRIAVFGVPAIGCLPIQRTLKSIPTRRCATNENRVAQMFNSKLSPNIKSLASKLTNSRLVYVDTYNPFLDLILNPNKYGLEEVTNGCCGTGLVETAVLCNELDPICSNEANYLFWDSAHPTEKGYQILVDLILPKIIPDLLL